MANQSKKTAKRRPAKSKTTKNKSSTFLKPSGKFLRGKLVIFVLLFAVIASILIFHSFAQSNLPSNPDDVIAAYVQGRPTVIQYDGATAATSYDSYSAYTLVLADGTVMCDSGSMPQAGTASNQSGDVATSNIGRGQVQKLHDSLAALNLDSGPQLYAPASQKVFINDGEQFMLVNNNNAVSLEVYPGAAKPGKLSKMQAKLSQLCAASTKKIHRGERQFNVQLSLNSKRLNPLQLIAGAISPKVYAYPNGTNSTANLNYATDQYNRIAYTRAVYGAGSINRDGCLDSVAFGWSRYMADTRQLYHNPNLTKQVIKSCAIPTTKSWTMAENVGFDGCTGDSAKLFTGFLNSPGHFANIVNHVYGRVGVGDYTVNNSNCNYVTQDFLRTY
jgi:uncharacterized protein YkwD